MEIGKCSLSTEEIMAALQNEKSIILATAADNRVTTRSMSHVNDGMTIYFQTGSNYLKSQQIRANPNVAISVDGYDFEGKATFLGHPMDAENGFFLKLYEEKHPHYTNTWSTYPEEVVVKVDVEMVRKWFYVDGKPFIAVWKKDDAI
jgi:nitroimidazol reductase NimA-like FMN-containing flavoprotein (pyridoxamine 5'-phosphate oxidase superfamily)